MTDRKTLLDLTEQLERLQLTMQNIQETIQQLQNQEQDNQAAPHGPLTNPLAFDTDRRLIHIGDEVIFLTRGLYNSTRGTVYKVSRNRARITARDHQNRPISRNPRNLRLADRR